MRSSSSGDMHYFDIERIECSPIYNSSVKERRYDLRTYRHQVLILNNGKTLITDSQELKILYLGDTPPEGINRITDKLKKRYHQKANIPNLIDSFCEELKEDIKKDTGLEDRL